MRVLSGTLCQYYYTFGFFLMALIAYFLNDDWKMLQALNKLLHKYKNINLNCVSRLS